MKFRSLLLVAQPVTITINNSQPSSQGWFWNSIAAIKGSIDAHPYFYYSIISLLIGGAVYYVGRPILFRSLNTSLSQPASSARAVQTNYNLQIESEQTRLAIQEVQNSLTEIKLEIRRTQLEFIVSISQQTMATDLVAREISRQLIQTNQSLLTTQEMIVKLSEYVVT